MIRGKVSILRNPTMKPFTIGSYYVVECDSNIANP